MNKKVYLAGPITGKSYNGCTEWRNEVKDQLYQLGLDGFSPMRHKEFLLNEKEIKDNYNDQYLSTVTAINIRDYNDVKTSGALLVNFLGASKVSIGTVMEIAWARVYNIPVVIVVEKNNIHQHGMLMYHTIVVDSLSDAIHAINTILNS